MHGAGNRKAPKRNGEPATPGGGTPKHNRYSQVLNPDAYERMKAIQADERLLELDDEIELSRVQTAASAELLNVGESLEMAKRRRGLSKEAREVKDELTQTVRNPNLERREERYAEADSRLDELIDEMIGLDNDIVSQFMAHDDVRKGTETTRKLVSTEYQRRKGLYEMLSEEEAYAIAAQIKTIVIETATEIFGDTESSRRFRSLVKAKMDRVLIGDDAQAGEADVDVESEPT